MGCKGHIVKIGAILSDHGGERQKKDEDALRLLYAELQLAILDDPRFARLNLSLFSDVEEAM